MQNCDKTRFLFLLLNSSSLEKCKPRWQQEEVGKGICLHFLLEFFACFLFVLDGTNSYQTVTKPVVMTSSSLEKCKPRWQEGEVGKAKMQEEKKVEIHFQLKLPVFAHTTFGHMSRQFTNH